MYKYIAYLVLLIWFTIPLFSKAVDESIWFADNDNKVLVQYKKDTGDTIRTIDNIGDSLAIVAVSEDHVWVSNSPPAQLGSVSQIVKSSGNVIHTFSVGVEPALIAVDQDYAWVAINEGQNVVQIHNMTGSQVSFNTGAKPLAIGVDENSVWVSTENGTLLQFNKDSFALQESVQLSAPGNGLLGLALDDSYIWVVDNDADKVYRVTKLDTSQIQEFVVTTPIGITVDQNNAWVSAGSNIIQIDKLTSNMNSFLVSQGGMFGISVDDNFVWAASFTFPSTSGLVRLSKANQGVALFQNLNASQISFSLGDMTGAQYDMFFPANLFKDQIIQGKANGTNIAANALDGDPTTYFQTQNSPSGNLKIKIADNETPVSQVRFFVNLIDVNAINLRWNIQKKKKGVWKNIIKGEEIIDTSKWVEVDFAKPISAKKFRIKFKNVPINDIRADYGISEIAAYES